MSPEPSATGLLGFFGELDSTTVAIERLRKAKFRHVTVFTPTPRHELEHALHEPTSPVRIFTLVGGLTGTATGFALAGWTMLDWPLVTGGKPIITIPTFVIIAFELTILLGTFATVAGLLITTRLPRLELEVVYDPSFSEGTFGVYVPAPEGRVAEARGIMNESGAEEVREQPREVQVGTI